MTDGRMHDALSEIDDPIPNDDDGKARVHAHAEEARRRLAEAQDEEDAP